MATNESLTKRELLELIEQHREELARKDDIIRQQDEKIQEWETAYNKLWRERFEARSARYIDDPDQLRIDFGDTPDAADEADRGKSEELAIRGKRGRR